VWDRQRDGEVRVEGVAVVGTVWAGKGGAVGRLKDVVDEAVVTARLIGQRLSGYVLIRPTVTALLHKGLK